MGTSPSQGAHIPLLSRLLSPGAAADCFSHEAAAHPRDLICPTKHKCLQQAGLCQQAQRWSREKAEISQHPPASCCKTALPPITSCQEIASDTPEEAESQRACWMAKPLHALKEQQLLKKHCLVFQAGKSYL